jgi:citrate lyase beta subunit
MLFVPATSERFFAKALGSDADGIIFDLEDSVAASQKALARKDLVSALNASISESRRWPFGSMELNPLTCTRM